MFTYLRTRTQKSVNQTYVRTNICSTTSFFHVHTEVKAKDWVPEHSASPLKRGFPPTTHTIQPVGPCISLHIKNKWGIPS